MDPVLREMGVNQMDFGDRRTGTTFPGKGGS